MTSRVVPELYCFDINVSKSFFVDVLGLRAKVENGYRVIWSYL